MNLAKIRRALEEPFFDSGILRHGFAAYMRDYEIVVQIDKHQFLYRFTHCPAENFTTVVNDRNWRASWDDLFTKYPDWERSGAPKGFVWGVNWARAYPGAELVEDSSKAREWSERLGKQMYQVRIETNAYRLDLIFHDLRVRELESADKEWVQM